MTTPDNNELGRWPDRDAMARSWVVRLKSGEATQRDLDMLLSWRAQNEENEGAFRRAARLWEQLGPALVDGATLPAASQGVSRRWFIGGGAAMAAAAAVALVPLAAPVPAGAREYRTGKGERRYVRLDPEVSAELNTDSRLLFWADAAEPRVELSQGEALISATCDPGRGLIATAKDVEVRAQVARFSMRSDGGLMRVACLEGQIEVVSQGGRATVDAGASFDFRAGEVRPTPRDVAESGAAWQRDLFLFKDRPAGEVIAELNRYRPGRVYLLGSRNDVRISGVIHLERADFAVDHIAKSLGMKVIRLPGGIAILRN
ncbi:transmembrane sensor [Sphingopyxis panaciterrae]|uniref:FecR family protein n=1 Tax=Sphingopyxis panaciterrae TaxID=363841 RepID=UPI001421F3A3|nr:FecR domain-containing protein [Sphingopyxis panaciterrae]NIJ39304.1 transmembrane sensor [Sphingopyxis panaciterrae]